MRLNEWHAIVERWRLAYGNPEPSRDYAPSSVKVACAKCNKCKPIMHRHHKRNDFFFALHMPDYYAARYIAFHPNDWVKLCDRCHRNIERYSENLKQELYSALNALRFGEKKITVEWCEDWRGRFLKLFEKWIKKPVRRRSRLTAKSDNAKSHRKQSRHRPRRKPRNDSGRHHNPRHS